MAPDTFPSFRKTNPACCLLVLSDTRSGTVLAADGALDHPQEYLDAIGKSARQVLAACAANAPCAVFHTPAGTRLFVTVPHRDDMALSCLTPPQTDVEALLTELGEFAERLALEETAA